MPTVSTRYATAALLSAPAASVLVVDEPSRDEIADHNLAKPIRTRRLPDKILLAFHQACDQRDTSVAQALLDILEGLCRRPAQAGNSYRRRLDVLVAAHERLWHIRHSSN